MNTSIICIGNRFFTGDEAGPLVFDRLQELQPLPEGVALVEGGLSGLNLLPLLETGGRVIFVDAVRGFAAADGVVVLHQEEILASKSQLHFDHGAGLPYLLTVLPRVFDGEMPEEILLVGIQGTCTTEMVDQAADVALHLAAHGMRDPG